MVVVVIIIVVIFSFLFYTCFDSPFLFYYSSTLYTLSLLFLFPVLRPANSKLTEKKTTATHYYYTTIQNPLTPNRKKIHYAYQNVSRTVHRNRLAATISTHTPVVSNKDHKKAILSLSLYPSLCHTTHIQTTLWVATSMCVKAASSRHIRLNDYFKRKKNNHNATGFHSRSSSVLGSEINGSTRKKRRRNLLRYRRGDETNRNPAQNGATG